MSSTTFFPRSRNRSLNKLRHLQREPRAWLYSFWKFSRPHTIIGTTLSVWSLGAIALAATGTFPTLAQFGDGLLAWLACLAGNIYIVGLNQLEDIDIDKINKPYLPLAAGEFSVLQGRTIVAAAGIAALELAAIGGPWLLATVAVSLAIGTAYSLPPIRLKRFPFFAAFCILSVRGAIVNLGLFAHFEQIWTGAAALSATVWALATFILGFSIAIALFKDVPDTEGDRRYQIATLTLLWGKSAVLGVTRALIAACYLGLIVATVLGLPDLNPTFTVLVHLGLLGAFLWRSRSLDLGYKPAIASFYQFIWQLFFLEYLLFPLASWLGH
ncbi:MAG: homogentisate phytyltransferase [Cyanobacteria bacterium J06641_5]